ncbi:MAG TPA: hypothetical protein VJK00_12870 [Steroidobacteraceae bacterium]|nr:hypothetical protein [Steroidobacteraceae bacterium]
MYSKADGSVACSATDAAGFRRARNVDVGIVRRAGGHGQRLQDVTDGTLATALDVAAVEHGDGSYGLGWIQPPARAGDDHFFQRIIQRGRP